MEDKPVTQSQKKDKLQKSKKPSIIGILSTLRNVVHSDRSSQKKSYTEHQLNERKIANWTRNVGWFTAALVLTSALGNWFIWGQLQEMRSSGEDTKRLIAATEKSAKAAQDAVSLAKETAERQLRAYVNIEKSTITLNKDVSKLTITISYKNTGQTPAFNMMPDIHLFVGNPIGQIIKLKSEQDDTTAKITVGANMSAIFLGDVDVTEYVSMIRDANIPLFVYGAVLYQDVFGKGHTLHFKYARRSRGQDPWILETTPDGNDSD